MSKPYERVDDRRDRAESHLLREGHTFGGSYRIERVLGEGVSSVVYLAERVQNGGERVALKVIHRHLVKDRQISQRFHREASILRKLRCPNLVALLDFGELDDGVLFMALELIEGRPLEELLGGVPIDPARAVGFVKQICTALEAAHEAAIVHRDLKPGNVIIERTGHGLERARVLDFGMAKVLRGNPTDSLNLLTEQNMVFGTPEYMAPEQARGDDVDARCDVYAAGVILYEMLAGSTPFRAPTPVAVMTAHLAEMPVPPSQRSPLAQLSPALEAVVLHALAKNPKDRYASASEFAEALERALASPHDVASITPPALLGEELATRDTERALDVSSLFRDQSSTQRGTAASEPPRHGPERVWLIVAIVGALIGILLGVAASISAR
jgi:eukaryotic-like serine/threonine-protein kinase